MSGSHLRRLIVGSRGLCRFTQRRWAQVHDIRFLATHPQSNQIYDKYKEKLDRKARQEGYRDIDALKAAYEKKSDRHPKTGGRAHETISSTSPKVAPDTHLPEKATAGAAQTKVRDATPVQTLSSFLDVEKTAVLPQRDIEQLWRLRHADNPRSLCAAMTSDMYKRIVENARRHPRFILPVSKEGQGAEIHFMQWTFPSETTSTVLFTHLAEFKLRGEYAAPHTTITHHLELDRSNGIVLLQGQVLPDRGVSPDEAKWLLICLQKFYGQPAGNTPRQKLLQQFSQGDPAFKVEELLEEADKIP